MDKTTANRYSESQIDFVKRSFSESLIFRISIAIKPSKATIPQRMQNGINLGYCIELSNEIAIAKPNKFKRHSNPKLKNAAFANIVIGR